MIKDLLFLIVLIISNIFFYKYLIYLSFKYNKFLSVPNLRSSHQIIKPRNGGIIIFLSFLISLIYFKYSFTDYALINFSYIIAISFLFFILGFFDDLYELDFKIKLIFQIIFSFFFILIYIDIVNIYSLLIFSIFMISFINIFNFMDGIDGYASVQSILFFTVILLFSFFNGLDINYSFFLAAILTNLLFLIFNIYPSKIFMGDSGSYFNGFLIFFICFQSYIEDLELFFICLIFLNIFIVDSILTIFIRLQRRENIFKAHNGHFYQILLKFYPNHNQVVLYLILKYLLDMFILLIFMKLDIEVFFSLVFIYLKTFLIIFFLRYKVFKLV